MSVDCMPHYKVVNFSIPLLFIQFIGKEDGRSHVSLGLKLLLRKVRYVCRRSTVWLVLMSRVESSGVNEVRGIPDVIGDDSSRSISI